MFYKVITIYLITICAADYRIILSKLLCGEELVPPSQPFKRHAIFPMTLKYVKHDDSSPISKSRSARSAYASNAFGKLQYAPLRDPNPIATRSSAPVESTETKKLSKSHLEPRMDTPDYNTNASSASRSPGHNAVYRIVPEPNVKEKQAPVHNYEKPIGINLHFESLTTTTTALPLIELSPDYKQKPLTLTNDHFALSPNSVETNLPVQDKSKRYSSHPKYHRLHLNIARVYSPGQVLPKVPAYARAYPEHFGIAPKPQANIPQPYQDEIKNTILFPVRRHRRVNYHPQTSILNF